MVSQYFFCPSGCLHKFVISFATQYVSARVATVPEKNQPLTYTILHFSLGSNRAHHCISAGKCYLTHKEPSLAFHLPYTATQPHSTMLQFVWHVPVSIFSCTRYLYYFASRRPPRCVWGCRHNSWLIPSVCLMTAPALCVHILPPKGRENCPVRPIRWHSQPRPFVPLSRGLTARSTLQC